MQEIDRVREEIAKEIFDMKHGYDMWFFHDKGKYKNDRATCLFLADKILSLKIDGTTLKELIKRGIDAD